MGHIRVLIAHRMNSRSCSYTKAQFMRVVHPVFEKYGIEGKVVASLIGGRVYEGQIEPDEALKFRKELEAACKLLGRGLHSFQYTP